MTQIKENRSYCELIKLIADNYKLKKQLIKTMEETGEFSAAISRFILIKGEEGKGLIDQMIEEMADVQVMIDQIVYLTKRETQFKQIRLMKVKRQIGRIESKKAKQAALEETK